MRCSTNEIIMMGTNIMDGFCETPSPPYYAVIFTCQLNETHEGYQEMVKVMLDLAMEQPGCYGAERARTETGFQIAVSYWQDEDSITNWKAQAKHQVAQRNGINHWYKHYKLRVTRIERDYSGPEGREVG